MYIFAELLELIILKVAHMPKKVLKKRFSSSEGTLLDNKSVVLKVLWPYYLTVCPEARFLKAGPDTLNATGVFWMNRRVSTDALVLLHQRVVDQTCRSHKFLHDKSMNRWCKYNRNGKLTCGEPVLDRWLLDRHGEGGRGWRRLRPEQRTFPW